MLTDHSNRKAGLRVKLHHVRVVALRRRRFNAIGIAVADFFRTRNGEFRIVIAEIERTIEIGFPSRLGKFGAGLLPQPILRIIGPSDRSVETLAKSSAGGV